MIPFLTTEFCKLLERVGAIFNCGPPNILFIDGIHTLVGARRAEDGIGAANILKPAFARGKLRAIAAISIAEYRNRLREIWRWGDVCNLQLAVKQIIGIFTSFGEGTQYLLNRQLESVRQLHQICDGHNGVMIPS